jgi:hypothetical protein
VHQQDQNANGRCADCDVIHPEWVSVSLGVYLCIDCSGVHRALGSHVSRIQSLKLDKLSKPRLGRSTIYNKEWEVFT